MGVPPAALRRNRRHTFLAAHLISRSILIYLSRHLPSTMGNDMSHQPYLVRQISQSSGKDEAAIQDFYSSFQNECPSGHMTPEDFSNLYQKVFSSGEAQDLRSRAFGAFSKNGNGSIDAREMNEVIRECYQMLGEDSHGKAEDMFNMMDKDGDVTITEQEFIRACLEDVELSRLLSIRT